MSAHLKAAFSAAGAALAEYLRPGDRFDDTMALVVEEANYALRARGLRVVGGGGWWSVVGDGPGTSESAGTGERSAVVESFDAMCAPASPEQRARSLSGQARWYLVGPWPVVDSRESADRKRPEPSAMAELVAAGVAERALYCEVLDEWAWRLTDSGLAARAALLGEGAGGARPVYYVLRSRGGEERRVTFAQFAASGLLSPATLDAVRLLAPGETYEGGEGTASAWSITKEARP